MKCEQCGSPLSRGDTFCARCGAPALSGPPAAGVNLRGFAVDGPLTIDQSHHVSADRPWLPLLIVATIVMLIATSGFVVWWALHSEQNAARATATAEARHQLTGTAAAALTSTAQAQDLATSVAGIVLATVQATHSPAATSTPAPTDTPTATDTAANTPVPSDTPTATHTSVPTNTPTVTHTPVPTNTPTETYTSVPTNTLAQSLTAVPATAENASSRAGLLRGMVTFNLALNRFTSGGWPDIEVFPFPDPEIMDLVESLGLEFRVQMGAPIFAAANEQLRFKRMGAVAFDDVELASQTGYEAEVLANLDEVYLAVTRDGRYMKFKVDKLDVPSGIGGVGQVVVDLAFQGDGSRDLSTREGTRPTAARASAGSLRRGAVTLHLSVSGFTRGGWPEISVIPFPEPEILDIFESSGIGFVVRMGEPLFVSRDGQARLRRVGPVELDQIPAAFAAGYQPQAAATPGHAYLAVTPDGLYCKFRVVELNVPTQFGQRGRVVLEWVAQTNGSTSFRE